MDNVSFYVQYDNDGNIISDERNTYTYGEYGQLITVSGDSNASYSYDERGNILTKTDNGETTSFTYANSEWKDQLTKVNDTQLTYDANGNMVSYGDTQFTWDYGKSLSSIKDNEKSYYYKYDENGIRTSKTVNGVTTKFNTLGGVVLAQSDSSGIMYFQYDSAGAPIGFVYNDVQYLYITNISGDVLGITDAQGNPIAAYTYDAWGKLLDITTAEEDNEEQLSLANANPLRYRGYYYDNETGYYYLQSRYYNPEWGRFISADKFQFIDSLSHLSINAYVYCNNIPIDNSDPNGTKRVSKETKEWMISRYKKAMNRVGYGFVYTNSESDNYHVSQDSNGIYSLTGEHRFNSGKKYYNSVFIYGSTSAWNNEYQEACAAYETSGGLGEAFTELATIPHIIVILIMLLTGGLVFAIRHTVLFENRESARKRYYASLNNGYYEFIQTLSVSTFNKGNVTTKYLITN